jgi:Glycosyl hydrolase family 30 beta sandwich domain
VRSHARVGLTSQIQPAGVDATAYAAKLPDGAISVVVLNKDPERDLALTLDFGADRSGAVEMEVLHAPALDAREAHITREPNRGALKHGRHATIVPHASGVRVTVR